MKPSFTLFGITLYSYSLLMIVGAGACLGLFAFLTVRRHGEAGDENLFVIEMLILSMAAALLAAMFFDSLFKIGTNGGFVWKGATFYGGLIGALALFSLLLALRKKKSVSVYERLCDLAACIPLGHFFGRIGCFLGGCCYGAPTQSAFGIVFPSGSEAYGAYGGAAVHPTQLYEAACLLAIFAFFNDVRKEIGVSVLLHALRNGAVLHRMSSRRQPRKHSVRRAFSRAVDFFGIDRAWRRGVRGSYDRGNAKTGKSPEIPVRTV